MTKVTSCTCAHDYQDEKHGKGQRVHNKVKTGKGMPQQWRCTVCNKVK